MKIKNTSDGPRGVFTEDRGLVTLAPGEVADLKIGKGEADNLADYFEKTTGKAGLDADAPDDGAPETPPSGDGMGAGGGGTYPGTPGKPAK